MARQVTVSIWCDVHMAQEEQVEGVELPALALVETGNKPRVIALCEVCRKELYEPFAQALAELGQPAETDAKRRQAPIRPGGGVGGAFKCPAEGCGYSGPTEPALRAHIREHHQSSLEELQGLPTPHKCPQCERRFPTAKGRGAHLYRSHGVRGASSATELKCPACDKVYTKRQSLHSHQIRAHGQELAEPLTCPECGDTFTTAKGMGSHRRRRHGVEGASARTRERRAQKAAEAGGAA